MKTFSLEKPRLKVFLRQTTLLGMSSIIFLGCNNKKEYAAPNVSIKHAKLKNKIVPKIEENVTSKKRIIYLTFDDGPNRGTENLVKILHKRNVTATTFLVGKHINGSKKQLEEFEELKNDSLIEIANHSFSHANNQYSKFYENSKKVVLDFDSAAKVIQLENKIARTPGRNIWRLNTINSTDIKSSKQAADELYLSGYKLVGWDLEWKPDNKMKLRGSHQYMVKKVDSIFLNDLEKTSRHLVFLTHDQYFQDEASVLEFENFIKQLQESNRFEFRKISEYPKINEILN